MAKSTNKAFDELAKAIHNDASEETYQSKKQAYQEALDREAEKAKARREKLNQ